MDHPLLSDGLECIRSDDFPGYSANLRALRDNGMHDEADQLHAAAEREPGFLLLTGTEVSKPQYAGVSP
jgi:hypothetical protein